MCNVTGCRHSNLDLTALSAKNGLLLAVLCSVVCNMVEKEMDQIGVSQDGASHLLLALSHSLGAILVRILLDFLNGGGGGAFPKTMMNDLRLGCISISLHRSAQCLAWLGVLEEILQLTQGHQRT